MSYIIPENTKSSIVLYLDSRDASSYLAQKTENAGTNYEYTADLTSYFQYVLKENIEVPLNQRALVSLNSATIPYSFYNIRSGVNDVLIYKLVNDTTGFTEGDQTFTIPAGNYSAFSLADIIITEINDNQNAGNLQYTFSMNYDSDKNKFIFNIVNDLNANTLSVEFKFFDNILSINTEMGFRPFDFKFTSLTEEAGRTSENVIDINGSIHGVYIRTNLVSQGTLDSQNGTLSNILSRIPIDVQSGGIIFSGQSNHKSIVDLRYINAITIRLTDERNRILDLNGLHFQLSIAISFLHAKKPISIPNGALSQNPELSFHNEDKLERTKERMIKRNTKIKNKQ